jgi:3-deoxy-7-phosphoheptulonate synthase
MEFSSRRSWGPKPSYDYVKAYVPPSNEFKIISGSCSVESEYQVNRIAKIVKDAGANYLRGGVYRAGTYPNRTIRYGWVDEGLIKSYSEAAKENGLKNIIEVLDYSPKSMDMISKYCSVFQVGARQMQNYQLLRALGQYDKPVFLKRHPGSTVDECIGSVEHLLTGGVKDVSIIERGSSTYHTDVRWTPSIHVPCSISSICRVPVIWDASHATGRRDLVPNIALAGVAVGAQGILVECHEDPEKSMSDADQAVTPETLRKIIDKTNKIRGVLNES